jgi:hypothetical protein
VKFHLLLPWQGSDCILGLLFHTVSTTSALVRFRMHTWPTVSTCVCQHNVGIAEHAPEFTSLLQEDGKGIAWLTCLLIYLLCAQPSTFFQSHFRPLPEQIVKVERYRACGRALLSLRGMLALGGGRFALRGGTLSLGGGILSQCCTVNLTPEA